MANVEGSGGGVAGSGKKYVDTEAVAAKLTLINEKIAQAMIDIDSYNTSAESLGKSSFRGNIEAEFDATKQSYKTKLIPNLEEIQKNIEPVMKEYNERAAALKALGGSGAGGEGGGSSSRATRTSI